MDGQIRPSSNSHGTQHSVCAVLQVATQGDSALSKWTTCYKPEFSLDVATYKTNKENNVDKVSNCIFLECLIDFNSSPSITTGKIK